MKCKGVILIEPKKYCNVGSIARSMKAFGIDNLIIVNKPKEMSIKKAMAAAVQGKDLIENVIYVDTLDSIKGKKIATASLMDLKKSGELTGEVIFSLSIVDYKIDEPFYLVMGRESCGLKNEELNSCDTVVTIPTNGKFGVLNLAQATNICLYELCAKNFNF